MSEAEVSVAWEARTDLGESPVWDELTQTLYFVVRVCICVTNEAGERMEVMR